MALPAFALEDDDLDLSGPPHPRGEVIPLFAAPGRVPEAEDLRLTPRPDWLTRELREKGVRRLFLGEGLEGRRLYAELAAAGAPLPLAGDLVLTEHHLIVERLRPARGFRRAKFRLLFTETVEEILLGVHWSRVAGEETVRARTTEALAERILGIVRERERVPPPFRADLEERLRRLPEDFARAEALLWRESRLTRSGALAFSGVSALVPREVASAPPSA